MSSTASATHDAASTASEPAPKLVAMIAEYGTPHALITAAEKVRDSGLSKWDAHSPFPLHGIDEAMGIKPTRLPWIVLLCGVSGIFIAFLFQWYLNAVDYPFIISGKPLWSIPANVPIAFEVTILLSAFGAFFGMWALNKLPQWHNAMLRNARFRNATSHKFFVSVDARDPAFDVVKTAELLRSSGADAVEECFIDPREEIIPPKLIIPGIVLLTFALIPPFLIARYRYLPSEVPRIHPIQDMDFQPKWKTQRASSVFADGRMMRPQIPGTVAFGDLEDNRQFFRGIAEEAVEVAQIAFAQDAAADATQPANGAAEAEAGNAPLPLPTPVDVLPGAPADGPPEPNWVDEFPVPVTEAMMKRGEQRFNIYCVACHGLGGDGDGLVTRRAIELEQSTWVRPISFHTDGVRNQPVGRIYNTIANGIRKMPAYGSQIPPEDRWAIVLYVRALQRSRNATLDDVPELDRQILNDRP